MNNFENDIIEEDKINIKEVILKYLRYWPLYLGSIITFLTIAKIQLRYSQNIYNSYATIKVLDQGKGGEIDLSAISADGSFFKQEKNLQDEIQIILSKRLLMQVVDKLELQTTYYSKGQVRTSELWGDAIPFKVQWIADSNELASSPTYNVMFTSANTFKLWIEDGINMNDGKIGQWIEHNNVKFKIVKVPSHDYKKKADNKTEFSFNYRTTLSKANILSRQLKVNQSGNGSEILVVSLDGPIKEKNEKIINTVIQQFNEDGIKDRRAVAENTENFVNERLDYLVQELDSIESKLVNYKEGSEMVSIELDASKFTARDEDAFKQELDAHIQLMLAKSLSDKISSVTTFEFLPADIGLSDQQINQMIAEHNKLVSQRNTMLQSSTQEHPSIRIINDELSSSLENLKTSINNYLFAAQERLESIQRVKSQSSQKLSSIPYKEKVLRNINRQQAIKENLYLFLLEKRETASLTRAVTSPSVKVVDFAFTNKNPVAPNRSGKYIIAFFMGLVLPIGFVYVKDLLDSKIRSLDDITSSTNTYNIPIIGEIPALNKEDAFIISKNDRSELAEAFRVVRTNLSYMNWSRVNDEKAKVILVTSSTKSEGKTFTSYNTAITLATSSNKVLLIGADLRNPQLHAAMGRDKNTAGLTTYLHDEETDLNDLIIKEAFGFDNLDVMLSGYIPPNPAELLLNGRFSKLMNETRNDYDFILIDSAPTLLVTDTFLIADNAHVSIYLTRAGVTDKRVLDHLITIKRNSKLPNMGILLNDIGKAGTYSYGYKYQYNYGYGYSYGEDKKRKKWWKIWKN